MVPEKYVWVFVGTNSKIPSGVFSELEKAQSWIRDNELTGTLCVYPVDTGCYQWTTQIVKDSTKEKLIKKASPEYIGSFTSAYLDHYHYENGKCE